MAHCVNRSSKEFKALAEQSNMNPIVLAAKISLWQETNGLDNFPTIENLNINNQISRFSNFTKNQRQKIDALLSFLEKYGFDVQESEDLIVNLAAKKINLNTTDIFQVAKGIAAPLAEMLSYSDAYYEIEKAVVETDRFKELYSDLLDEFTDSTKRNLKRLATKQIFKELLEKGFSEELAADLNIDKTLWDKIVDFVTTVINKLRDADWDVIDKNISNIVEKTFKGEDYIRLTKKEGYKQVDFQQAFDENAIAKDIMTKIGTNPNIVLTGSIAYATQGTVYRKIETVVHDLDFVNNGLTEEEIETLVKDNYPDAIKAYSFFDKYKVDTYLIPPAGFKITNVQRRETGKITSYEVLNEKNEIVGTYQLKYDVSSTGKTINETEIKTGVEAMLVDFFSQDTIQRETISHPFKGSDGKTYQVQLSKFEAPFEAKLTYSRFKDIWDYNRFIPNKKTMSIIDTENIVSYEGTKGAAQYDRKNNEIKVNRNLLLKKFQEKAWTKPRKLMELLHGEVVESYAQALPENQFNTYEEWEQFVINHEYQHSLYSREDFDKDFPNKTKGDYETEINKRALEQGTSQFLFSPQTPEIGPIDIKEVNKLVGVKMPSTRIGVTLTKSAAEALRAYNKKQNDHKIEYKPVLINENTGLYKYDYRVSPSKVTGYKRQQAEIANKNADAGYRPRITLFSTNPTTKPTTDPITDNTYNGNIYNSQEDLNKDKNEGDQLTLFNVSTTVPTNFTSVVNFKKTVLKEVETRLKDLQQKSKTDKSSKIKEEIRELTSLKQKVNKDISDLINDPDIVERTMAIFNNDIAFMKSLIAIPTLENLQLAESYIDYFKTISDYSGDIENPFVDTTDPDLIDTDVRNMLDKLTVEVQNATGAITRAKKEYLLDLISDSDVLKTMFGNDAEEIRDIILAIDERTGEQTQKDLDKFSKYILSADTSFGTKDLLGQLIVNVLKEKKASTKVEANQFIQAISNIEDKVKKELAKLGFGITYFSKLPFLGKHISEVSYDLFYQKTSKGNKTGRLIGKFAHKWFSDVSNFLRKSIQELDIAIANGDNLKANQILAEKYNWLNDRVDFIEIGKLPEVINNPAFSMFSQYFDQNASSQYSADLKARIGEYEYKKLVQQQTAFLEQYLYNLTQDLNDIMTDYGVSTPALLPTNVIHNYNISAKRKNPFEFINSHNSGQQGRIDYVAGSSSNQYQSFINYNTYIPKQQIQSYNALTNQVTTADSGYYDPNFSTIENNPVLLEFWETISEATEWMNNNLNDANTPLSHNSMLRMEKSFTDVLLGKKTSIAKKAIFLKKSTGSFLKGLFTKPIRNISETDKVALRNVSTIQDPVNTRFNTILMALSNAIGTKVTSKSTIDLNNLNAETLKILQKVTQLPINTIKSEYGTTFNVGVLKEILTNQVMEEQTFNLPVMLRAYLDATGTYKAQKEALPMINILKDLYENIKNQTPQSTRRRRKRTSELKNRRVNAEQRMNYWIDKAVKNRGEDDMSDLQYYWAKLGKTYTSEEKMFLKQAKEYLTQLEGSLGIAEDAVNNYDPVTSTKSLVELEEERDAIYNEIQEIKNIIDNVGHYYALSAAYDTIASRLTIFAGLAWNIKAQIMNRLQGLHSALIHDTGRYWTQGNIFSANAFVNRKGLRHIPGMHSYRQEVRKAKLLIEMLGILQDATNELDRAKNNSGLRGWTKKANPFYLTEYVEWHNQTPMVLAMLMDQYIESPTLKDEAGNPVKVPIFNSETQKIKLQGGGTYTMEYGFPAYNVVNGKLVLKPDFESEENKNTWMNFSTKKGTEVYNRIDTTLAHLNGDYRKDAAIYAKKGAFGRSLLAFKSWVGMNYYVRFARNTTNLNLGIKDFDGAYTGALKTGSTSLAGGMGIATIAGLGAVVTGSGLIFGGAVALGSIGYGAWKASKHKKATGEEARAMLQLVSGARAIIKRTIGVPVNFVSGKNLVKAHTFDEFNISPEEKQNLIFIINEISNIAIGLLLFIMYKNYFGDDEEKEPKLMIDPVTGQAMPNPNYGKEKHSDLEKGINNLLENQLTELIQGSAQFTNPKSTWDLYTNPASVEGWLEKAAKVSDAIYKTYTVGPNLQSGPNEGKNRITVAGVKATLPGIIGEYILYDGEKEGGLPYSFGFGNAMADEYQKNDLIDAIYVSDYKKDMKDVGLQRDSLKQEKEEYWKKELEPEMEKFKDNPEVMEAFEKQIKKLAKQEVNATLPLPNRALYDDRQTKKE